MKIVVRSNPAQYGEFITRGIPAGIEILQSLDARDISEADIYFDLLFEEEGPAFTSIHQKPVFVNAVIKTNKELPVNYIRINAWNGFFVRELIEVVATDTSFFQIATEALKELGWKYQAVPDSPGMIAARVIAMIINEAYFGLGEGISTKAEIDIAMKSGTNYPYGPFEWSEKIGLLKIAALLKKLSEEDRRYALAPALEGAIVNGQL
jgi:3-hydroxybutyryl-CoA dehydrogenase